MSASEREVGASACPGCGAALATGTRFCTACGAASAADDAVAEAGEAPRTRARNRGDADAELRAQNRREFGRIKSVVLIVRSVFLASIVLAALQLLTFQLRAAVLLPGDEAAAWRIAIFAVLCAELAVSVAGALLVLRAPLVWTTTAAAAWTLDSALLLLLNGFALPPGVVVRLFFTVSFWFAVGQAGRVQRLMAADPSLQLMRKRIDPSRRVAGGVVESARKRQRQASRLDRRRRWTLFGAIVGACALLGVVLWWQLRPPAVDASVATFAANWARNDVAAIRDTLPTARQRSFRDDIERRGWAAGLPALGEATIEQRDGMALVTFPVDGGTVDCVFNRLDSHWILAHLAMPALQASDPAPTLAAFRSAWQASGTEALVAMVRPTSRDRLGRDIARLLERRDWAKSRPALGECAPDEVRDGRVRASFAIGNDELRANFEYWHPGWVLSGIALPER
jgi:hypothetical protein